MTKLLLIRHGESMANQAHVYAGHTDFPLTEKGLKQAELTAEFIVSQYSVDVIYASDLKRAFQTGKAVADRLQLPMKTDQGLREIYAGEWEGHPFDELMTVFKEDYNVWLTDVGNAVCTGGESVRQLQERILTTLEKIAKGHDGETVVIATHATPVRVTQCAAMGLELGELNQVPWVTNASVTEIMYEQGSWSVGKVSMDDHLADFKTAFPKNV